MGEKDYITDLTTEGARRGSFLYKKLENFNVVRSINGQRKLLRTNEFDLTCDKYEVLYLPYAIPADCEFFYTDFCPLNMADGAREKLAKAEESGQPTNTVFMSFIPVETDSSNPNRGVPFSKKAELEFVMSNFEALKQDRLASEFKGSLKVEVDKVHTNGVYTAPQTYGCELEKTRDRLIRLENFERSFKKPAEVAWNRSKQDQGKKYVPVIHFVNCAWRVRVNIGLFPPNCSYFDLNSVFDFEVNSATGQVRISPFRLMPGRSPRKSDKPLKPQDILKAVKPRNALIDAHLAHLGIGSYNEVYEFNEAVIAGDFVKAEKIAEPFLHSAPLGFRLYLMLYKATKFTNYTFLHKSAKFANNDERVLLKYVTALSKALSANSVTKKDPSYHSKPGILTAVRDQFLVSQIIIDKYASRSVLTAMLADAIAGSKSPLETKIDEFLSQEFSSLDTEEPFLRYRILTERNRSEPDPVEDAELLEIALRKTAKRVFFETTDRRPCKPSSRIKPTIL